MAKTFNNLFAGVPTRLFNRHWDNFIAHVRDHHPRDILEYDEYEKLRKLTCDELKLKYRPGKKYHLNQYLNLFNNFKFCFRSCEKYFQSHPT